MSQRPRTDMESETVWEQDRHCHKDRDGGRETGGQRDRSRERHRRGQENRRVLQEYKRKRNAKERKKKGRQLSRPGQAEAPKGPEHSLALQPSAGKGRDSPRWALGAGAGTSNSPHLLPIWSPLTRICIPRLSLQSHSPFKTTRGFSSVAANPGRHLRCSWVVWGPADPRRPPQGQGSTRDRQRMAEGGKVKPLEGREWPRL